MTSFEIILVSDNIIICTDGTTGFFFLCVCVCVFRAAPAAYGGSQARGPIRIYSRRLVPEAQQHWIQAASATYTTVHGNTRSLTYRAQPGIEPTASWFLVGFVSTATPWERLSGILI